MGRDKRRCNSMTLFQARLKREGRYEAFMRRVREVCPDKTQMLKTWQEVMPEFGYISHAEELNIYDAYMAEKVSEEDRKQREEAARRAQLEVDGESIFATLPLTASWQDDVAWVSGHPKMWAATESAEEIQCSYADLEPYGKQCPSRRAFSMLKNYARSPNSAKAFYDKYSASKAGQQSEESEDTKALQPDPQHDEIMRMLKDMGGGA